MAPELIWLFLFVVAVCLQHPHPTTDPRNNSSSTPERSPSSMNQKPGYPDLSGADHVDRWMAKPLAKPLEVIVTYGRTGNDVRELNAMEIDIGDDVKSGRDGDEDKTAAIIHGNTMKSAYGGDKKKSTKTGVREEEQQRNCGDGQAGVAAAAMVAANILEDDQEDDVLAVVESKNTPSVEVVSWLAAQEDVFELSVEQTEAVVEVEVSGEKEVEEVCVFFSSDECSLAEDG